MPLYNPTTGTLTKLATFTFTGAESSTTFSAISGAYNDLLLTGQLRSSKAAAASDVLLIQFNGDTTAANYTQERLSANNVTAAAQPLAGTQQGVYMDIPAATAPARANSVIRMTATRYAGTSFDKGGELTNGYRSAAGAAGQFNFQDTWQWLSNAAITSITVRNGATELFVAGSIVTLYGIS